MSAPQPDAASETGPDTEEGSKFAMYNTVSQKLMVMHLELYL